MADENKLVKIDIQDLPLHNAAVALYEYDKKHFESIYGLSYQGVDTFDDLPANVKNQYIERTKAVVDRFLNIQIHINALEKSIPYKTE